MPKSPGRTLRHQIPATKIEWEAAGDVIQGGAFPSPGHRFCPFGPRGAAACLFDLATARQKAQGDLGWPFVVYPLAERGWKQRGPLRAWPHSLIRTSSSTASTRAFPQKQPGRIQPFSARASRTDCAPGIPHQAVVEFVATVTRPLPGIGQPLLSALNAAPGGRRDPRPVHRSLSERGTSSDTALRGVAAYQLSWFDAHLWAYAEHYGLAELWSEDFQHDRLYGTVRVVNPFV